ncbi:hypothetical protein, partial [Escherichia coli]|uniref:hypothetical protein n=1 Tax=Escherichia coli TaxID=562 RepID=UPI001BC8B814
ISTIHKSTDPAMPLPKVSQRSPESLSAASFDTTMRKTMRNEKNRLKRDTARFRGYSQNTRCLEEILIKI